MNSYDELYDLLIQSGIDVDHIELPNGAHYLAMNPETPIVVLEFFSRNPDVLLLERIAGNPSTPPAILSELAHHESCLVRGAVADNPKAPQEALKELATDESCDVRYQLAENSNVSKDIIEQLTADDNPYVAHRASETLKRIANRGVVGTINSWLHQAQKRTANG